MASVVGLDFVGDRLHVALVDGSAGSATVRAAFSAPLPHALTPANAPDLGRWLKQQLAEQQVAATEAAVSLGRGHSNFRTLQVPDCPPEELPGLVQLTLEGEGVEGENVVDFDAGPVEHGQRTVTAAYAAAGTVEAVRETLKAAGLNCRRIVLRPYAMRFLREQMLGAGDGGTELLLIPTADGIDLSIWAGRRLEMARSVSVGGHGDPNAKLSAELRRTLAAYQNNKPGATLTAVAALAGDADAYAPSVQNALQRSIASADPAKKLRNLPESKAAWGAVAAAWQAGAAAPPTLNLLSPRKAPPPKYSARRLAVLAGAFLFVALGTVYLWRGQKVRALERQIAALEDDINEVDAEVKRNAPIEKKSAEVKKWVSARVDWLDQLRELAALTPPTDKAIFQSLHGEAAAKDAEARLKLDLRARDSKAVMESMLVMEMEPGYAVQANRLNPNPEQVDFALQASFEVAFAPKGARTEAAAKGANGKKTGKSEPAGKAAKSSAVAADVVPPGMQRVPTSFGMKKAAAPAVATARPSTGVSTSTAGGTRSGATMVTPTVAAPERSSNDAYESEVARLLKLPLDEFEREIAKKPSLLRNQWRKRVEEAKAKAK